MSFKSYLSRKLSIRKFRFTDVSQPTHSAKRKRLPRAFRRHIFDRTDHLPPKVDLRPDMTPIENQLNIGSSVANCLAGAYEYLTKKTNDHNINVSRLFIYYNARIKTNKLKSVIDEGCSIIDAIKALEQFGTCLESIWPYNILYVNTHPDYQAYEQAESHKIHEAFQIDLDLNEMKLCLTQGFPFAFGLRLFTSFNEAAENGIVPVPDLWNDNLQLIGSHALLAVGYSDQSEAFIVRNSWGENWGDKGYCYISYDYMTNPDLCFDIWSIRKLTDDDFGREYWHFNDDINYRNDNYTIKNFDEEYSIDSNNQMNRKDYYKHKNIFDDSWNQYRNYKGNDFWKTDEDYFDDRRRRDRYDRNNEPFDQQFDGYTNNGYNYNRNLSYPFYDRYQYENDHYSDYDRYDNYHRKSTF